MSNSFYNASGAPVTSSPGASATIRAEFALIAAGFDKLPTTLTANAVVVVNAGGTALTATTTPNIGTPSAGVLTNCTGLPVSTGISGFGTGVAAALAINTSTAGSFVVRNGALGTPSSGTLTSCTGLPVSTGISGLGTGVATALAVNIGSAGAAVLFNGALGTPSSGTLTNCTGLPLGSITGFAAGIATFLATPSSANLKAAVTDETGSGALVFATSPGLTTPTFTGTTNADKIIASSFESAFNGGTDNGYTARDTVDAASAFFLICRNAAQTAIGGIQRNLSTNAVLFQTSSDYRMKENIVPMSSCMARAKALMPRRFAWKGVDNFTDEGFIAHELQAVIPGAVTGQKDAIYADGSAHYQCVDYSKVVPLLAGALKEAIELIEQQGARIAALEAKGA